MRKIWGGQSVRNPISPQYTCSMIRLGELYLNYAEAANEAYGPNTPAPGATMTAVQAINFDKGRWTAAADTGPGSGSVHCMHRCFQAEDQKRA